MWIAAQEVIVIGETDLAEDGPDPRGNLTLGCSRLVHLHHLSQLLADPESGVGGCAGSCGTYETSLPLAARTSPDRRERTSRPAIRITPSVIRVPRRASASSASATVVLPEPDSPTRPIDLAETRLRNEIPHQRSPHRPSGRARLEGPEHLDRAHRGLAGQVDAGDRPARIPSAMRVRSRSRRLPMHRAGTTNRPRG